MNLIHHLSLDLAPKVFTYVPYLVRCVQGGLSHSVGLDLKNDLLVMLMYDELNNRLMMWFGTFCKATCIRGIGILSVDLQRLHADKSPAVANVTQIPANRRAFPRENLGVALDLVPTVLAWR